jgi:hypothetical protein
VEQFSVEWTPHATLPEFLKPLELKKTVLKEERNGKPSPASGSEEKRRPRRRGAVCGCELGRSTWQRRDVSVGGGAVEEVVLLVVGGGPVGGGGRREPGRRELGG